MKLRWLPQALFCLLGLCAVPARADEQQAAQVSVAVEIDGLDDEAEQSNVESWLGYSAAVENKALSEERARSLHAGAAKAIALALEPFGYYQPAVVAQFEGQAPRFTARYRISLGEPVRWQPADVAVKGEGRDADFLPRLLEEQGLPEGGRALHADYEAFKARLVSAAREDGYRDATLSGSVLAIDPKAHSAQAQLSLDTGPRYFFGATTLTGGFDIRENLLRRYLRYQQGEPYSPKKLLDSQFALSDIDYFDAVQFETAPEPQALGQLPITATLTPRKNRRDSLGLGYGTDTGLRGSIGSEVRRLNRQGDKLSAELRVSEKSNAISTEIRHPQGSNPGEYLSLTGSIRQEQFSPGVSADDYKIGTSLNRTLGSWKRRYYLEFTRSITSIGYSAAATKAGQRLAGETSTLVPGVSFSTAQIDDAINATRGYSLFLDAHGAEQDVLSSVTFLQGRALLRGVLPLPQRFRLSSRAEIGGTAVRGFNALPLEQRFFAGGDDSVRGYNYRDLGVRDIDGNNVGGKFLSVVSVELERAIYGPYGAALFWDAGGVGDTPAPKLHHGAGIGLRYRAPFGSVRIDLAHPFDRDAPALRLHIGVRVGL